MRNEQLNDIALSIFVAVARCEGLVRWEAEESWRQLGSDGRGRWRTVARAAADAVARNGDVAMPVAVNQA